MVSALIKHLREMILNKSANKIIWLQIPLKAKKKIREKTGKETNTEEAWFRRGAREGLSEETIVELCFLLKHWFFTFDKTQGSLEFHERYLPEEMKINPYFTHSSRALRHIFPAGGPCELPLLAKIWDWLHQPRKLRQECWTWHLSSRILHRHRQAYTQKSTNVYTHVCMSLKKHLWKGKILVFPSPGYPQLTHGG